MKPVRVYREVCRRVVACLGGTETLVQLSVARESRIRELVGCGTWTIASVRLVRLPYITRELPGPWTHRDGWRVRGEHGFAFPEDAPTMHPADTLVVTLRGVQPTPESWLKLVSERRSA